MPRTMRKFGFEIEWSSRHARTAVRDHLLPAVSAAGQAIGFNETPSEWTIKPEHCGSEITSPAMPATASNFEKVRQIMIALKNLERNNHTINRSTGFHVHFSINDLSGPQLANVLTLFRMYESALLSIQPRSRHNNSFVYRLDTMDQSRLTQAINSIRANLNTLTNNGDGRLPFFDHYSAINMCRWHQRHTMEIRYAASTLRARKIINWIQVLLFIIEAGKRIEEPLAFQSGQTTNDFIDFVRNTETGTWLDSRRRGLCAWMNRRYLGFNRNQREQEIAATDEPEEIAA